METSLFLSQCQSRGGFSIMSDPRPMEPEQILWPRVQPCERPKADARDPPFPTSSTKGVPQTLRHRAGCCIPHRALSRTWLSASCIVLIPNRLRGKTPKTIQLQTPISLHRPRARKIRFSETRRTSHRNFDHRDVFAWPGGLEKREKPTLALSAGESLRRPPGFGGQRDEPRGKLSFV